MPEDYASDGSARPQEISSHFAGSCADRLLRPFERSRYLRMATRCWETAKSEAIEV
jgi:hypothetical protein